MHASFCASLKLCFKIGYALATNSYIIGYNIIINNINYSYRLDPFLRRETRRSHAIWHNMFCLGYFVITNVYCSVSFN